MSVEEEFESNMVQRNSTGMHFPQNDRGARVPLTRACSGQWHPDTLLNFRITALYSAYMTENPFQQSLWLRLEYKQGLRRPPHRGNNFGHHI